MEKSSSTPAEMESAESVPTEEEPSEITDEVIALQEQLGSAQMENLALQTENHRLQKSLDGQGGRLDETLRAFRNAQAEFERTKERITRESTEAVDHEKARALKPLLVVIDHLHLSLESSKDSEAFDPLYQGVKLVYGQFLQALSELGLEEIDPHGTLFDPDQHEAVGVIDVSTPEEDKKVVQVIRKGFRAGEIILRPALVQVGRYTGN